MKQHEQKLKLVEMPKTRGSRIKIEGKVSFGELNIISTSAVAGIRIAASSRRSHAFWTS